MATLEKIRKRSVLLVVVVFAALLAFILGDFFNSSRSFFGPGDTVAKTNGAKVTLPEYQALFNKYNEIAKQSTQALNPDIVEQTAIRDGLRNALLEKEFNRLGIAISDDELSQFIFGEKTAPGVMQLFAQKIGAEPQFLMQLGLVSPLQIKDAIKNPGKYQLNAEVAAQLNQAWLDMEKDINDGLRLETYGNLVSGLFTVNALDAKQTYDDRNVVTTFDYVSKDFTAIADKDVKLTDDDFKAVYDQRRGAFKLSEESRYVSYIVVNVAPSEADRKAADSEVHDLVVELGNSEGIDAVNTHRDFNSRTATYTKASLVQDNELRTLAINADSLHTNYVQLLPNVGTHYAIAKVLETSTGIDTVKFSLIPVPESQDTKDAKLRAEAYKHDVDSVMAKATIANFDSLASLAGQFAGVTTSLVNPDQRFTEKILGSLADAPLNQIYTVADTITNGNESLPVTFIINVSHRSTPTATYKIATVSYDLTPSDATGNDLLNNLRKFVGNNATAEAFEKNAEKAGYHINHALVSATEIFGDLAPGSMSALKWAMNHDNGDVSNVFTLTRPAAIDGSNQYLLAVAVHEAYDGDYIPATSMYVKEMLKPLVTLNKKARMTIDQYKGKAKTLEGYASLFKTQVSQGSSAFGDNVIQGTSSSPELIAAVATAKPGELVGPIKGNGQIYYIKVKSSRKEGRPYNFAESAANFGRRFAYPFFEQSPTGPTISYRMLRGDNRVENNILEFKSEGDQE